MDDITFDYETADVDAGHARFPERPLRSASRPDVADVGTMVRERGSHFARHAWDESGHL